MLKTVKRGNQEEDIGICSIRVPIPFTLRYVNLYIVGEKGNLALVDCGVHTDASLASITRQLQDKGYRLRDIHTIVITHCHHDHYGLVGRLKALCQARVLMHQLEADRANRLYRNPLGYFQTGDLLLRNGLPPVAVDRARDIARSLRGLVHPAEVDEALSDNQKVHLGARHYWTLWLPGHTVGHMGLYDPTSKTLIGGDLLLPKAVPHVGLTDYTGANPLADFMASLKRVKGLEIETVFPGHGHPFSGHRQRVDEIACHYQRRTEAIFQAIGRESLTAYQLARRVFDVDFATFEGRLRFSETLAHLEFLAGTDKVEKNTEGDCILFTKHDGETR
jgi:glyoxylase-like metal-dependent hydrolase (beta-lactamase superfamily II)